MKTTTAHKLPVYFGGCQIYPKYFSTSSAARLPRPQLDWLGIADPTMTTHFLISPASQPASQPPAPDCLCYLPTCFDPHNSCLLFWLLKKERKKERKKGSE